MAEDRRFTQPLYTFSEAARYVGMSPSTLASWAKGYTRHFPGRPTVSKGPIITSLPTPPGAERVPFIGLVEATVVQAFRQTGLPLQRIRRALEELDAQGELEHALASKRLFTDGAQILYDYAESVGDRALRLLTLTEVTSGQRVFHEVIVDYLQRITFEDTWATGLALPITPEPVLYVRPDVASGDPLFVHGGAPLSAVLSRRRAGESVSSIADDYDIPVSDIEAALGALLPAAA
ncbi:MAG: DUF433 domain-containing protein [Microthrixaceae bacterium]